MYINVHRYTHICVYIFLTPYTHVRSASGGGLASVVVGGVASGVGRAAAKGGEIGVGVGGEGGVEMEADVGWLLCVASPCGALDDTDALGKATVGNGGADGIGEAVGNAAHLRAVRVSSESGVGCGVWGVGWYVVCEVWCVVWCVWCGAPHTVGVERVASGNYARTLPHTSTTTPFGIYRSLLTCFCRRGEVDELVA